ncbi:MAG: TPR end-of-group domain-containing protein [Planctomycetota bacterium]
MDTECREEARKDTDFDFIRDDPRFKKLAGAV